MLPKQKLMHTYSLLGMLSIYIFIALPFRKFNAAEGSSVWHGTFPFGKRRSGDMITSTTGWQRNLGEKCEEDKMNRVIVREWEVKRRQWL